MQTATESKKKTTADKDLEQLALEAREDLAAKTAEVAEAVGKLEAARIAAAEALARAGEAHRAHGAKSKQYENADQAVEDAERLVRSCARKLKFAQDEEAAAVDAERRARDAALTERFVREHPMMFVDRCDAAIREQIIEPMLVQFGYREGSTVPLVEVHKRAESIAAANAAGFTAWHALRLEHSADPIPGELRREKRTFGDILQAARGALVAARCEVDPIAREHFKSSASTGLESSGLWWWAVDGSYPGRGVEGVAALVGDKRVHGR